MSFRGGWVSDDTFLFAGDWVGMGFVWGGRLEMGDALGVCGVVGGSESLE